MRFRFRLALAMKCSLKELYRRFSAHELTEWQVYESVEPFGERGLDERFARLTAIATQSPDAKVSNYRLILIGEGEGQTEDQMKAALGV